MDIPTHIGKREDIGRWPPGFPDDYIYLRGTVTLWVEVLSPPAFYKFKETPRRFYKKTGSLVGLKGRMASAGTQEELDLWGAVLVFGSGISGVRELTAKEKEEYIERHIATAKQSVKECRDKVDSCIDALAAATNAREHQKSALKNARRTLAKFRGKRK